MNCIEIEKLNSTECPNVVQVKALGPNSSYNIDAIKSTTVDSIFMQKAKFGFAPYLAGYGKLHTWLIYELSHMPEDNKKNMTHKNSCNFNKYIAACRSFGA